MRGAVRGRASQACKGLSDLPGGNWDEVDKSSAWLLWGLCNLIIHEFTRAERNNFVA